MTMASATEVKQYLAHWFQLGKKIVLDNGQKTLLPPVIFARNGSFSPEFESCWQEVILAGVGDCYLEGTHQTIAALLSPAWEFIPCARCEMPVPMSIAGQPSLPCPCHDLEHWPNSELPTPHVPVDSQQHLRHLHKRLLSS